MSCAAAIACLPFLGSGAEAACPAPGPNFVLSGNAACLAPLTGVGEQIRAGDNPALNGGFGSVSITSGEVVTLESGPSPGTQAPFAVFGRVPGGNGSLTMSGAGTVLQLNGNNGGASFQVGREGTGSATVSAGAEIRVLDPTAAAGTQATLGESVFVGRNGGTGTLTLNNGSVTVDSLSGAYLFAGASGGVGTVTASNGSTITLRDRSTTSGGGDAGVAIGRDAGGGSGTLSLNGSTLAVQSDGNSALVNVGREGGTTGTMTATGSTVSIQGTRFGTGINVGRDAGATGTMTLTGSTVTVTGTGLPTADAFVTAGIGGTGTGIVDSTSLSITGTRFADIVVGRNDGSVGTMTVRNGSTVSVTHETTTGTGADTAASVTVGRLNGSNGALTVTGAGTSLTLGGTNTVVQVGREAGSSGTMRVQDGASVTLDGTAGNRVFVGRLAGASGALDIASGGQVTVSSPIGTVSSVHVGGTAKEEGPFVQITAAGTGLLRLSGAGSSLTAREVIVGAPASTPGYAGTSGGGTLLVGAGTTLTAETILVGANGLLGGTGTITGNVILDGGTLAPGASPGTLSIIGNLEVISGILRLEIGGTEPGSFDVLNVTRRTLIADATIILDFIDGFAPVAGQSFELFTGPTAPVLENVIFQVAGLAPGFQFTVPETGGLGFTAVTDGVSTTAVPEPGTLALLGVGLAGLAAARRRRRAA